MDTMKRYPVLVPEVKPNAFDDYIARPDPTYTYRVLPESTRRVEGEFTAYVINMTSQSWLTEKDSSQPVWWHFLYIIIPDRLYYTDTGFVWITGGSNKNYAAPDPLQDEEVMLVTKAIVQTGLVGAVIRQVPNQPIMFPNDPRNLSRYEDDIIGYTWRHFIEGGENEPDWLLRFPMTKAVVRAMDTVTEFANKNISKYFIGGESKRGWTTWTTGAMDRRVIGIMPVVLDCLNLGPNLHHHYQSLDGWTLEFEPYWSEGVTKYLDSDGFLQMSALVDPYAYIDRLVMPKYVVSAGGDEFFLPDDSHYWYQDMMGPTYLRIHANAEHSFIYHNLNLMEELSAFMMSVKEGVTFPSLSWDRYENRTHGVIRFYTDMEPVSILGYQATTLTAERRDFRLVRAKEINSTEPVIQPVIYKPFHPTKLLKFKISREASSDFKKFDVSQLKNQNVATSYARSLDRSLEKVDMNAYPEQKWADFESCIIEAAEESIPSEGSYVAEMLKPVLGWRCFFVVVEFPGPRGSTIRFTSESNIIPDTFPVPPCKGNGCFGVLV